MSSYSEHNAKEVIPNLILGGLADLKEMLAMKPDVLVPLCHLPDSAGNMGFCGEILHYPITDYGVLPDDVLDILVEEVLERYNNGKRIAIFCFGGQGRTGYVASCLLYRLGENNPIGFIQCHYSISAVETDEQINAVNRYCKRYRSNQ